MINLIIGTIIMVAAIMFIFIADKSFSKKVNRKRVITARDILAMKEKKFAK